MMHGATRQLSALCLVVGLSLASCGGSDDSDRSETMQWLRAAGKFDDPPDEVACLEAAMKDLLSENEREEWLSHDPATITVDEIQVLPHAIDVADRCRWPVRTTAQ